MYTIYSLGDTWYLGKVMDAIAMVSGSDSSFVGASAIAAMVGVFMIMFQALLKGGQALSLQIFLVCYIFYMGCFHTTVDVAIEGVYSDQDVVQKDNIPAGPAILGSIISSVGHGLTEKMEQAFAAVDNPVILGANGGYLNSLYTINNLARLSESDKALRDLEGLGNPYLGENIRRYIAECTTKAVYVGKRYGGTTTSEMQTTTTDGLKHIIFNSEFYGTLYRDNNGNEQTLSCKEAGEKNALDFQSAVTALTSDTHKICEYANIMGFEKDMASCNAGDYLNNVSSAWEHLRQSHYTMQSLMAAGITRNLTHEGLAMGYRTYGNDLSATMIYQAIQQRNVQWTAEQSMFLNSVKPIMSFIEGFFYAISPFAGIMVWLGMMGLNIFFKYLIMLIWIQLWLPILSIANLFITTSASRALDALPKNSNGMSLQEYEELVSICQDRIAVGGMMMAATPVLSLMVITGSVYAFTQLTSRMQGADHINEKMVAPDAMQPSAYMATQSAFSADSLKSTLTGATYQNYSASATLDSAKSAAKTNLSQKQDAVATNASKVFKETFGDDKSFDTDGVWRRATEHADSKQVADGLSTIKQIAQNLGYQLTEQEIKTVGLAISGNLEAGVKGKGPASAGASASAGGSSSATLSNGQTVSETAQQIKQFAENNGRTEIAQLTSQVGGSIAISAKNAHKTGESAERADQLSRQASDLNSSTEQYSEIMSAKVTAGRSAQVNEAELLSILKSERGQAILRKAEDGLQNNQTYISTKNNISRSLKGENLGSEHNGIVTLRALSQTNLPEAKEAVFEIFREAGLITSDQQSAYNQTEGKVNEAKTNIRGSSGVNQSKVAAIEADYGRVKKKAESYTKAKHLQPEAISNTARETAESEFTDHGKSIEKREEGKAFTEVARNLDQNFPELLRQHNPKKSNYDSIPRAFADLVTIPALVKDFEGLGEGFKDVMRGTPITQVYDDLRSKAEKKFGAMFDGAIAQCKGLPQEELLKTIKDTCINHELMNQFDRRSFGAGLMEVDSRIVPLTEYNKRPEGSKLSNREIVMNKIFKDLAKNDEDFKKTTYTLGGFLGQNGSNIYTSEDLNANLHDMMVDSLRTDDYSKLVRFAEIITPTVNIARANAHNQDFYSK